MTIGRVAEMLGEDEDRLQDLAMDMDPEDGCLSVYGTNKGVLSPNPRNF